MRHYENISGYVLVGGRSARMGRNKALIPYSDTVLADYIARELEVVTSLVTLIGPPEEFRSLARPILGDLRPGNGPLGGIETALTDARAEWSLIVACDMPDLNSAFLLELAARATSTAADCVVPLSDRGWTEPLCAVWRRTCLGPVREAIDRGQRKTQDILKVLRTEFWQPSQQHWFTNLNTPEDWESHQAATAPRSPDQSGDSTP